MNICPTCGQLVRPVQQKLEVSSHPVRHQVWRRNADWMSAEDFAIVCEAMAKQALND